MQRSEIRRRLPPWRSSKARRWRGRSIKPTYALPGLRIVSTSTWATTNGKPRGNPPNGWKVISNPPVKFRQTKNTSELPYPTSGGSLEQLKPFVNPTEDGWTLIQGCLLDCIKGVGPYYILYCHRRTRIGKVVHVPLLPGGD